MSENFQPSNLASNVYLLCHKKYGNYAQINFFPHSASSFAPDRDVGTLLVLVW